MTKAFYVVEIVFAHPLTATATSGMHTVVASVSEADGRALVQYCSPSVLGTALFADRYAANVVGQACRWDTQQYRVIRATGAQIVAGIVVPESCRRWASCRQR